MIPANTTPFPVEVLKLRFETTYVSGIRKQTPIYEHDYTGQCYGFGQEQTDDGEAIMAIVAADSDGKFTTVYASLIKRLQ